MVLISRYTQWQQSMSPLKRQPKLFKLLASKGCRMFKKFLEPRAERRPKSFQELNKWVDDRWLAKGAEKEMAENEPDELCPSMYSFHSSPEEKNKLLYDLAQAGIETTVDRVAKKERIRCWIETSVIAEEDEEEGSSESPMALGQPQIRAPVAGHISSIRGQDVPSVINSTIKDSSRKHLDPRTGHIQVGPSEMIKTTPEPEQPHVSTSSNGSATGEHGEGLNMISGRLEFKMNDVGPVNDRQKRPMMKMDSGYSSTEKMLPQQNNLRVGKKYNSDRGSLEINNSSSFSSSKDVSPFTDSDSQRSTGFVNVVRNSGTGTRKDTAYDYVKVAGVRK